jgi:hypothetical protein
MHEYTCLGYASIFDPFHHFIKKKNLKRYLKKKTKKMNIKKMNIKKNEYEKKR